jgi:hypothetical protein
MKKKLYIVCSNGGEWSNDDFATSGPAGVYSTHEFAQSAIREMMEAELEDAMACGNESEDIGREGIEKLSFEELEEEWSDRLETAAFVIHERILDADLLDVHSASE